MAVSLFQTIAAPEDANARFAGARALYEMAVADMHEASPEMEADCILRLYCHSASDAGVALIKTPAPDMAGLLYKLELFRKGDYSAFEDANDLVDVLIEDARELARAPAVL